MEKTLELYTWEQISKAVSGTVFLDKFDEGVRFIICKGGVSLCAYVGVPKDHPIAGFSYDDIPVSAHGGFTYSEEGDGTYLPSGWWWYGWDYAHAGDYCDYYDRDPLTASSRKVDNKKWMVREVESDSFSTLYNFRQLLRVAEKIKAKP